MTTPHTRGAADLPEMVSKALREAYNLGQRYWQQADSEYISQHKKADDTRAKFLALVEETCAALAAGQATAAQPVAEPAKNDTAYAELPEPDIAVGNDGRALIYTSKDIVGEPYYAADQLRAFADATHTLRASRGQASSQAGEYPALVCDYCGALTPDPWHSSGMLHGKMSKHIHSCDACAARGVAKAHLETAKNNLPIGSKENP